MTGWHVIVVWECELAKPVREARLERLYTEITASCSMASNELAGLANVAGSVNAGGSIVNSPITGSTSGHSPVNAR